MLNFDFLEKGLEIVSPPQCVYDFSFSDYLYVLRYWAICVLQLFTPQVVTP